MYIYTYHVASLLALIACLVYTCAHVLVHVDVKYMYKYMYEEPTILSSRFISEFLTSFPGDISRPKHLHVTVVNTN